MKLFFIGWSGKELGMLDAVALLKEHHDIVYWSGVKAEFEACKSEFPETIFHDYIDALHCVPPVGRSANVPPPHSHPPQQP